MNKERMRPDNWLELVLSVPFSALTPMVGWQEGQRACKKSSSTNPQRFSSGTDEGGPEGNWLTENHL